MDPNFKAKVEKAAREAFDEALIVEGGSVYADQNVPGLSDQEDPGPLTVSLCFVDGSTCHFSSHSRASGDGSKEAPSSKRHRTEATFLLQSGFKPLSYAFCIEKLGCKAVHQKVGSTGSKAFGIFDLDPKTSLPHNPLINSGALVVLELLNTNGIGVEELGKFCLTLRKGPENASLIRWDERATEATRQDSFRNRALCGFMASKGTFPKSEAAIAAAVEYYCVMDCLKTTCTEMAMVAAIFANGGKKDDEQLLESSTVRSVLSMMLVAGMYESSGEWSRMVGIPAKIGVGGGIWAVVTGVCDICVHCAPLDAAGNSVRGVAFIERLVSKVPQLSLFS